MSLISDWTHAILRWVSPNEAGLDQKCNPDGTPTWDDPTKVRFGAYRPADGRDHYYLGVIGMDRLTHQGSSTHRDERGFLAFKLDNNDGQPAIPCLEGHFQRGADTDSDPDMLCVFRFSSKGIEIDPKNRGGMSITVGGVPIAGPAAQRVSRFYSDDGRFCYNVQGPASGQPDGLIVQYDTHHSTDESTWTAVGTIPRQPL